ncbi:hypothetical protein MMC25_005222 [Agyrium rufum]|nr:hypothetical protein [Agyrium rufum]
MSRLPLTRRSNGQAATGDPGFIQQGEVDWVAFSNTAVSITIGALNRLSGAGVQEITYVGALQLTTRFKLGDIGYRRVYEAVEKTQCVPAFNNVVYFGFGYRSFLHFLAESVTGTKCIALCACLSEAHGEDLAARVIGSLWREVGFPEDYQPSLLQFKCLVKACAGVLAPTTFSETMGVMLGPYRNTVEKGVAPEASDPNDIAKAMIGLFEVSMGVRSCITVVGGAECSFIAAVSQWLFGFKVHIEDSHGTTMFTSSSEVEQAQVRIRYMDDQNISKAVVSGSTYVLGAALELLRSTPDVRLRRIRTRIPWNTCLSHSFGQAFMDLLSVPSVLGSFLGSAARLRHALATGESDVLDWNNEKIGTRLFIDFVETSYGQGFRKRLAEIFPELRVPGLLEAVQAALSQGVDAARSNVQEAVTSFCRRCMCSYHRNKSGSYEGLCLATLALTLLELVTIIASIEFGPEILPTEQGFHNIYHNNNVTHPGHQFGGPVDRLPDGMYERSNIYQMICMQTKRESVQSKESSSAQSEVSRSVQYASFEYLGLDWILGIRHYHHSLATQMAEVICLFTGYGLTEGDLQDHLPTAVTENGICVYMDCLEVMTTRPELSRRIHLIPGHIAKGNRAFDSIWDGPAPQDPYLETVDLELAAEGVQLPNAIYPSPELQISAIVDEPSGPGRLYFHYRISTNTSRVLIRPGAMTRRILWESGKIVCSKSNCDKFLAFTPFLVRSGWDVDNNSTLDEAFKHSKTIVLYWKHTRSDLARLLAIHKQMEKRNTIIIVRRDECLPCAIRSVHPVVHGYPGEILENWLFHVI